MKESVCGCLCKGVSESERESEGDAWSLVTYVTYCS